MAEARYEKSGYCYPNLIARIYLDAIEEMTGPSGTKALLNVANMQHLIDRFPPANLDKEFDFADFAHLNEAMDTIYGPRGGRALAVRAGRTAFDRWLKDMGPMVGLVDDTYRLLPLRIKVKAGLRAIARAFSKASDQISYVLEEDQQFVYVIERCPICWGRQADGPICHAALGVIQEALTWGTGGKTFKVAQTSCAAGGDPSCKFSISKEPVE